MHDAPTYVERLPVAALTPRVRTVWVHRTGASPYTQHNLPTGGMELHCPIGGPPQLVGPLTGPSAQVLPPYSTVVGVRFWPGAAAPLLGRPTEDLVDATVSLDELWGDAAARLGDLLAAAPGPDAALELLQQHLIAHHQRAERPDALVAEAVRRLMPWQPVDIGTLTSQLAISASQLRRRFRAAVGLGPKTIQRTLRFQGFLALAQSSAGRPRPHGRVGDLFADVGYADQAHLNRECLRLTGVTPRQLLGHPTDPCGSGHDHSASYRPFLAAGPRTSAI